MGWSGLEAELGRNAEGLTVCGHLPVLEILLRKGQARQGHRRTRSVPLTDLGWLVDRKGGQAQ